MSICHDWSMNITRQPDGEAFYLHCTGGVRCAERDTDVWYIEPVFDGGGACAKGFMTKSETQRFLRERKLKPIAFQRLGWHRGVYHSSWSPIVPGRKSHMEGPADLWGHIATNLAGDRTNTEIDAIEDPTHEKLAKILDNKGEIERLAHSISLSLRNMDIAVEQVAEFYNEKLVNLMSTKSLNGERVGSFADSALYAHVHSFFMHLGAARDYLAALIALRIGKNPQKTDALSRLEEKLRLIDLSEDALLTVLANKGYLGLKQNTTNKVEAIGWLKDVTDLRNMFVHHRPYGAISLEQTGYTVAIEQDEGLYRYTRPFILSDGAESDILDLVSLHYANASALFLECADASGYDVAMMTLTDDDIISIELHND